MRIAFAASLAISLFATDRTFEVSGRITPELRASVSLHGATTAFSTSTLAERGRFRFADLQPGSYTLIVFVPGRGEIRQTIEVGPGTANEKGRVEVEVPFDDARATPDPGTVSARDLSIPEQAQKEYHKAQKVLGKRDTAKAIEHLNRAVEIAPLFAQAWNNLGTIAYHEQRYEDAAGFFRRALQADPSAYEPLVNLGGVLINLNNLDEAYTFNLHAVLRRPNDPLANAQFGMTYLGMGKLELAEKYLLEARRLDPAHFSNPQLLLAEIYLREKRFAESAAQLEEFLKYHPDSPNAQQMRENIAKLKRISPA
jgi:tetratricopeptide (TPR) repeat protein